MNIKVAKYLTPLLVYVLAFISFSSTGLACWYALIYTWIFIPLVELFSKQDETNMQQAEEELAKHNRAYDYVLYSIVIVQFASLFYFLQSINPNNLNSLDTVARVFTMGLLCGSFGINVGHELGHRVNKFEQTLAKLLLMTSLYMHFFIEHNKGHHKNVATPEDPSSARRGEMVYAFYCRTIIYSYISAWKIANSECLKKHRLKLSFNNEMIQAHIIQIAFVGMIYFLFGGWITLYFLIAAFIGILMLETVNYIEHYGLSRKPTTEGKFERAMPQHSWNSNHVMGRLMLFELSRHSDHHYMASRKYQILRHHSNVPQMPTGYPGMMLLSLIPPLWFYIMHNQIQQFQHNNPSS
ncbi:MAG: alkane 1-monooxygenase [Chitinophagaceae bacterium]|nr:alkane 1-monooxygenase [Chitinophagaceae bacterium]